MKTKTLVPILVLVLTVLIIIGSCATGKKAVKASIESVYGEWANTDYNTKVENYGKFKIRPDGIQEVASHTELEYDRRYKRTFTIIESWMDSDGNKYYKVDIITGIREWYELWRINETDTVLEFVKSHIECPTEIDLTDATYVIYYRQ